MLSTWSSSRKLASIVVLLALVALVVAFTQRDGSSDAGTPKAGSTGGATAGADGDSGSTAGSGSGGTGGSTDPGADPGVDPTDATYVPPSLPVQPAVTTTEGLHPGDAITVEVAADEGSFIYGLEMRLCTAGTVVKNDADMLPGTTGRCVSRPFANGGDGFKEVASDGARTSMTATYTVGTGTDTYPLDDGGTASVTCDHDHPCVLAVKYQIPNGFGFRTYPVTFA